MNFNPRKYKKEWKGERLKGCVRRKEYTKMQVLNLHSHKITHEAKSDAAASYAFLEASEDIAWLVFCDGT